MKLAIQPLHGKHDEWIATLVTIRKYVESHPVTKDDLKSWYQGAHGSTPDVARVYINSLFASGLLCIRRGLVGATFPRSRNRNREIIKIIDENVVFIMDMMNEIRAGIESHSALLSVGKRKYGLSESTPPGQIERRSGWLCSAGMVKRTNRRLRVTKEGKRLLRDEGFVALPKVKVNAAEFCGGGEGEEHRTLKEVVYRNCRQIVGRRVDGAEMEYASPSGDRVDVVAWTEEHVWYLEVKSHISQDQDIERGIWQCVKYGSVGEAMEVLEPPRRKVKSMLVVEHDVTKDLRRVAAKLKVSICTITGAMRRELGRIRSPA